MRNVLTDVMQMHTANRASFAKRLPWMQTQGVAYMVISLALFAESVPDTSRMQGSSFPFHASNGDAAHLATL